MAFPIPLRLKETCREIPERLAWLAALPSSVRELEERWSFTPGLPFDGAEVSCAWVAPVTLSDGTQAVLKVGMPHFEAEHEIEGLRFWNGDPTVHLIEADRSLGAMLIERCEPGTHLRTLLSEPDQDVVIAQLLRRLWRPPGPTSSFRPLAAMISYWMAETLASSNEWSDGGLTQDGLRLFEELLEDLPKTAGDNVVLATDLHAGNVLRAKREPWLVIDPKPFVGEPAYDATQHLLNCKARLSQDVSGTIGRFADLAGLDSERIRLWLFARLAAEPREDWSDQQLIDLAREFAF